MPNRITTDDDGTVRGPSPAPRSKAQPESKAQPGDPGDDILAAVLIRMWTLASGRTLRSDVPPDQLSREELIAFWADDMTSYHGRHAGPSATSRIPVAAKPGEQARRATQRRRRRARSTPRGTESPEASPAGPHRM
jgi:hypothetical protein